MDPFTQVASAKHMAKFKIQSQFVPLRSSPSFWLCCSARWGKVSDFLFSQPSLCFLLLDIPVSHRSSIDVKRFELDLLREFQSEWFEVAIWPSRTGDDFPEFFAPDEVIESFPVGSPNRNLIRTRSARRSPGRLHLESGLYSVLSEIFPRHC